MLPFSIVAIPSVAIAQEAVVRGVVIDAVTLEPIEGASVYSDAESPVLTGPDGRFELAGRPLAITVLDGDYQPVVVELTRGFVTIKLTPRGSGAAGEVIEISERAPLITPGAIAVERSELAVIPGARGDVLSGVKNLPGIANNGSLTPLSSGLIIRGASPETSRILIDGFEIPVLYHFLGVQSVIPTEMISGLEYLPGAFDSSYGRATGGIVAVSSRDELPKRTSAFAELSFVNLSGFVETPLGDRGGLAVAARRSVIDAILAGVLPSDSGLDFTAYPRYYDYQATAQYRPTEHWKLSGFVFGSDDRVELVTDGDNPMDPAASGQFSNATSFTRAIASARYRRPGLALQLGVSGYTDTNHFRVGADRFLLLDRDGIATRNQLVCVPIYAKY